MGRRSARRRTASSAPRLRRVEGFDTPIQVAAQVRIRISRIVSASATRMNSARPEDPEEDSAALPPDAAPETWRGFTLNAFQRRAISAIRAGRNVLVGAPTGA